MHKADRRTIYDEKMTNTVYHRFSQARQLQMESPGKNNSHLDRWWLEEGTWAPVAQTVEHLTCNREVVGSMPAWVSLTFFQHSLAKSAIYIYNAQGRQTNHLWWKDDEHGLPQVQPGETTPDGVTWQKQQSPGQVMAGRGDVGPGSSDGRAPDM